MAVELTWEQTGPGQTDATLWPVRACRLALLCAHIILVWLATALRRSSLRNPHERERLMRRWSRRLLQVLKVRTTVKGVPVPQGKPVLFVANHVSWLDIQALSSVDAARFVAKTEVREWPLVGAIAARARSLFIERGSRRDAARVKDEIAAALRAGDRVAVFPEATTTDGTRLKFFYAALLQAAVDTGALVQPVAIRYPDEKGGANPAAAYVDNTSFVSSLFRILREPNLEVQITFGNAFSASGKTRRQVAATAQRLIALDLRIPLARMATRYVPFVASSGDGLQGRSAPLIAPQNLVTHPR